MTCQHIKHMGVYVFTDNDFDKKESANFKTIFAKCLTNSIASLLASDDKAWDFSGKSLSDADIPAIVKALDGNTTVTSLDLSDNCFTETGLADIVKMMETNSTITKIELSGASVLVMDGNDTQNPKRVNMSRCG